MESVTPGSNWIQRHIIQQEILKRQAPQEIPDEEPQDPLAQVKQKYFLKYTELTGNPGAKPDQSDDNLAVYSIISNLVDLAALRVINSYTQNVELAMTQSPNLQPDLQQFANQLASVLGRGAEEIIDLAVQGLAQIDDDPLLASRIGRAVRRIIPHYMKNKLKKATASTQRKQEDLLKDFLQEFKRKNSR